MVSSAPDPSHRSHPIGLHRTRIVVIDGLRLQVDHLEAVDR
jgi:tRNA (Thr-GGU) A37 N-methylase